MNKEFVAVAQRLQGLREIMDIGVDEISDYIGVSRDEYIEHEKGNCDFSFTFLLKASQCLGVDITDILTGESAKLSTYSLVRKDKGLPIKRRSGFDYQSLVYLFKNRKIEAFVVTAKYDKALDTDDIHLSTHKGQELDYILSGTLRMKVNDAIEIMSAGDSIIYDSGKGHGMVATGGEDCIFLAVVTKE